MMLGKEAFSYALPIFPRQSASNTKMTGMKNKFSDTVELGCFEPWIVLNFPGFEP